MKLLSLLALGLASAVLANPADFDSRTGALSVAQAGQTLWSSGPHGLWRLKFRDGTFLSAADFATNAVPGGTFRVESSSRLVWRSAAADVVVTVKSGPDAHAVDLRAEVTPKRGESLMLDFPAQFDFPAATVKDFVYPGRGNSGPGLALNSKFFQARPDGSYLSLSEPYPPLFADFALLTTTAGASVALYGVQPRPPHEPWHNPTIFVPGQTAVGGGPQGGWFSHAFATYARPRTTVRTPRVRIRTGATLESALADYAAANTLTVSLSEKVTAPGTLDKLKRAPLLHLYGDAAAAKDALAHIPAPSIYHPSGYLKGGFDKQYPDHLPPNRRFGTMAELVELYRFAQSRGHLVSPYTNPTWWCDHPRGPSFVAAGDAPIAIGLHGRRIYEKYGPNDGWTVCFWHPAVQQANRKTVRGFTQDAPVDVLFQDQCGARAWRWDFNPAAPSPTAYAEGMISMNEEDSRRVPLGTEDGWDQICNRQTMVCGCCWRVVPLERRPDWCKPQFKTVYPPDTWRIEPVNLRLFHDKALFYMHDLAAFVTNERVLAWMLALGYNLSYNPRAKDFVGSKQFQWYQWLHVMQSQVISRIAGQPLVAFRHDRSPLASVADPAAEADDGVITARWGEVAVAVNLGDIPRTVAGHKLAPYGWWIEGPGLRSAHLDGEPAFVEAEGRRRVCGP